MKIHTTDFLSVLFSLVFSCVLCGEKCLLSSRSRYFFFGSCATVKVTFAAWVTAYFPPYTAVAVTTALATAPGLASVPATRTSLPSSLPAG